MQDDQQPQEEPHPSDETGLTSFVPPSPDQGPGARERGDYAHRTPTRVEILKKLDKIPGLVVIDVLTPAKANAMRAAYDTILTHLDDSQQSGAARIDDADVITILRQQPELLKALQPFLTPEQLDLIVREAPK